MQVVACCSGSIHALRHHPQWKAFDAQTPVRAWLLSGIKIIPSKLVTSTSRHLNISTISPGWPFTFTGLVVSPGITFRVTDQCHRFAPTTVAAGRAVEVLLKLPGREVVQAAAVQV